LLKEYSRVTKLNRNREYSDGNEFGNP